MKFKEFAIWPFMGLDLTPRKSYRYRLSMNKKAIEELRKQRDAANDTAVGWHNDYIASEKANKDLEAEIKALKDELKRLEAENKTLKDELKRLEAETKRQYKAYKALADRQEETEKELETVLAAKKAVEIDNAMLQEKVEWQMRKIKKLDQPRKKGRFSKNHSEPSFAPDAPGAEEIAEAVAVVEEVAGIEVEGIEQDTTGAPDPIGEVMATAEVVPEVV